MPLAKVINIRRDPCDPNTPRMYIGRGSTFGNPFPMRDRSDEEREIVINAFEKYAREAFEPEELAPLIGKELGCFCKSKACHGDVLMKLLEEWEEEIVNGRERRDPASGHFEEG